MRGLLVALCLLLTGCTIAIPGTPTAAGPDSRVGRDVADVLPTPDELTELTGVEIEPSDFPPSVGGRRVLPDGIRDDDDASELQCLGATTPGMFKTYEPLPVWAVARKGLDSPLGKRVPSVDVDVTVIALTSDAAAVEALASFTEQWQACEGKTMVTHGSGREFSHRIDAVATRGELLTATVTFGSDSTSPTTVSQRALGIRANCVVDVEVGWFDAYEDTEAPADLAERVASLVLDKIAAAT